MTIEYLLAAVAVLAIGGLALAQDNPGWAGKGRVGLLGEGGRKCGNQGMFTSPR